MATLEILSGKMAGEKIALKPGKQIVGLRRSADIRLRDKGIGFEHAAIYVEDGKIFVEDLGSKTGTRLDGTPVESKTEVTDGAKVQFGDTEAVIRVGDDSDAATGVESPARESKAEAAATAPQDEKKLSVREKLALRRKQRATAKETGADGRGAKSSVLEKLAARRAARTGVQEASATETQAEAGEIKDRLRRTEIDLRRAVRELKEKTTALEAAQAELEAIKAGDRAGALEKELEETKQALAERDETISQLRTAVETAKATAGAAAVAGADAATAELAEQVEALQKQIAKLNATVETQKQQLERAEQEKAELQERLEAGAVGGYSGVEEENQQLREALAEKNLELDRLNAELLELRDNYELLERKVQAWDEEAAARKTAAEKQVEALSQQVATYLEQKQQAEEELARFKKEYEEFEERVLELQAQVDDLTERNEIYAYRLEQADQKVGALVREKLADMQYKTEEMVQSNAQLQSLVEAYEQKIEELDMRVAELEAENAELESLLKEEREAHERTKAEAEREQRKLRKRLEVAMAAPGGPAAPRPPAFEEASSE